MCICVKIENSVPKNMLAPKGREVIVQFRIRKQRIIHSLCSLYLIMVTPVTGRGGPQGCETSRLPHFLDSRLTDGREVVSLTHRSPFTPRKVHGTHFCWRISRPQGHNAAGSIRSIEKSSDLIGNRTRDLPACSIVQQPTTLPRAPVSPGKVIKVMRLGGAQMKGIAIS
jgi:hypothetical protein